MHSGGAQKFGQRSQPRAERFFGGHDCDWFVRSPITHYEHPVSLINAGYCCNAQIEENNVATVQINHGECMNMDMPREWKNGGFWKFKAKAAAAVCDPGYVMAGLHRDGNGLAGNHQELNDIDYFRCCKPAV